MINQTKESKNINEKKERERGSETEYTYPKRLINEIKYNWNHGHN